MKYIFDANEFVAKLVDVATNYKTLYVMGCFGAPMNTKNKERYCNNHAYNRQVVRQNMIRSASNDTFGFDCIGMVKGLLWGWNGDVNRTYGGAGYIVNEVPDTDAKKMLNYCYGVSTNFTEIKKGEFLWMDGHCGVYGGKDANGRHFVIESTPKWENGVQISYLGNLGETVGHVRKWTKHGKLKWIDYAVLASTTETKVEEQNPISTNDTYKAKKGDTLSLIANSFGLSLSELVSLNPDIKNINIIRVGQIINVNKNAPKTYTVQKGDTLSKIAKLYGCTTKELAELNGIKFLNFIRVGQVLKIN